MAAWCSWFLVHPASKTHWATRFLQLLLSSAASSTSSQLMPIFLRSFLTSFQFCCCRPGLLLKPSSSHVRACRGSLWLHDSRQLTINNVIVLGEVILSAENTGKPLGSLGLRPSNPAGGAHSALWGRGLLPCPQEPYAHSRPSAFTFCQSVLKNPGHALECMIAYRQRPARTLYASCRRADPSCWTRSACLEDLQRIAMHHAPHPTSSVKR